MSLGRAPVLALSVIAVCGCGSGETPQPVVGQRADSRPAVQGGQRPRETQGGITNDSSADPKTLAEAQDLYKQGLAAYNVGAYDEAEGLLKRSITLYPFLAPANLALGKVFLLKGAANHDESLIESARLMFDMAHSIDPSLREPVVMLELFKPRGAN